MLVVRVVDKKEALLSLDHSFDKLKSLVSLALENDQDHVAQKLVQSGSTFKNALELPPSASLKLSEAVLNELDCWLAKLMHQRRHQRLKHINGKETCNRITFVPENSKLDCLIRVHMMSPIGTLLHLVEPIKVSHHCRTKGDLLILGVNIT